MDLRPILEFTSPSYFQRVKPGMVAQLGTVHACSPPVPPQPSLRDCHWYRYLSLVRLSLVLLGWFQIGLELSWPSKSCGLSSNLGLWWKCVSKADVSIVFLGREKLKSSPF